MRAPTSPPVGRSDAAETGSVVVRAEQKGTFYVYDSNDRSLTNASANTPISLFPGNYKVKINGSESQTSVKAGQNAILETGSVVVRAEQKGTFYVYDSNDRSLTNASANTPISLFPGNYKVKINGSESQTSVKAGQNAILETGSVVVRAEQKGTFYVYDSNDRSLTNASANTPISLFPGNYKVKINGSESQTSVKAGQNAILETGSVVVRAEQKGTFYVYDSNDRSLTNASANTPISLFPGTYKLRFQGSERIVSVQASQ